MMWKSPDVPLQDDLLTWISKYFMHTTWHLDTCRHSANLCPAFLVAITYAQLVVVNWTSPCQSVHVRGTGVCLRRSHILQLVTDILSRTVSELTQLIVQILDTLCLWATLWGLRNNVRYSSWAHWKARSGLLIRLLISFFSLGITAESLRTKKSKIGDFAPTRTLWSKISGRRGRWSWWTGLPPCQSPVPHPGTRNWHLVPFRS